ncbi:unnamed protein product [Urochloa humidicola]
MTELTKREAAEPANRQPPRKRMRFAVLGSPAAELDIEGAVVEFDPNSYGPDVWTEVAKHLCPVRLLNLSVTCRWMHSLLTDDTIWRHAFFRDLNLPAANTNSRRPPHRSWRLLYLATFDGSHAYWLHQSSRHMNAYRIGGLILDSSDLLLTAKLPLPKLPLHYTGSQQLAMESTGTLVLNRARCGIWIADVHLLKCPVCNNCDGRMIVLEARHCDLFLEKPYRDCTWKYTDLGKLAKRLSSSSITRLVSSFQEMRDSTGEIVSIRISQCVLK